MTHLILGANLMDSLTNLGQGNAFKVLEFIRRFRENPANPGLKCHTLNTRAKGMWSARINDDLRAILHKDGDTWALLHANHHDAAYRWAERREAGRNPVTGALQVVETVETVREIERIIEVVVLPEVPPKFQEYEDAYLLSLGVPENWLATVRKIRHDDNLLTVCERLPEDVAERLFDLAAGEFVTPPAPIPREIPIHEAPATRDRFYLVDKPEALEALLAAPMDRWIAFLHPSQKTVVTAQYRGPARVSGSAGTGKTVVAMHRARHLARRNCRVLLTSYVKTLCTNIDSQLHKFCTSTELEQITVATVHKAALDLVRLKEPKARPIDEKELAQELKDLGALHAPLFDARFVREEWLRVIRAQGIDSWPGYRRARRTGRGKGLSLLDRKQLWLIYSALLDSMSSRSHYDWQGLCLQAARMLKEGLVQSPYDAVIIDEVQDLSPPELRFAHALCAAHPGNLMLCGDTGQRIYPGGFSLSALGIETRGRSTILRINYRTTEQIRRMADQMLGEEREDMDGGSETTRTRSMMCGPQPLLRSWPDPHGEMDGVAEILKNWLAEGLEPGDIGIFARTLRQLDGLEKVLERNNLPNCRLTRDGAEANRICLGTMHRAKGLEFKHVLVFGCYAGGMPLPNVLRSLINPQEREEAIARERRLLYVAMTRARDRLVITWHGKPSPFLVGLDS